MRVKTTRLSKFTVLTCGDFWAQGARAYRTARKEKKMSEIQKLRIEGGKFSGGQTVVTRGVNARIAEDEEFSKFVFKSLKRHFSGDWGDLPEEDKKENEYSLDKRLRLLSAYKHESLPKIWIITEADRSVTTVLFPEEY